MTDRSPLDPIAEPFRINVPQADLDDLRHRLRSARWAADFANDDGRYGLPKPWLESMTAYWADGYDWRTHEAEMNSYSQYRVRIDGVPIHFLLQRGTGKNPIPIVLTHGWPWTFWDWKDVIGPLADPAAFGGDPDDSFDVVVPSLPGFGFSSPLDVPGIGVQATARMWDQLMRDVLGYESYVASGGDWGGLVSGEIGLAHPSGVRGVHITLPALPRGIAHWAPEDFAEDETWMLRRSREAIADITSHVAVHRSDPQTLAYALQDSPIGLAAWLWERRRAWSDPRSYADVDAERDFLCTTASIYWFTNTIGTSMRYYLESVPDREPLAPDAPKMISVPTAFGIAPRDVVMLPRAKAADATDLRQWTVFERGGHFTPHEVPDEWIADVRRFARGLDRP